jgi:hypothetical protein
MVPSDPNTLVEFLRRGTPRTKVGLWRFPLSKIGKEAENAISLGAEAVDVSRYYYQHRPSGADFARLSAPQVFNTLDEIASSNGTSNCVLIYNLDLLLAALKLEERHQIWKGLFNRFPNRPRSLIIAIPDTAKHLLPSEDLLEKWKQESRLV